MAKTVSTITRRSAVAGLALTAAPMAVLARVDKAHAQAQQTTSEKSLYERLGGVFAIAAVVDHFSDAVVKNPIVGQKSKNPQVKEFANQMISDHTSLEKSVNDLAKKLNVTPQDSAISKSLKQQAADDREPNPPPLPNRAILTTLTHQDPPGSDAVDTDLLARHPLHGCLASPTVP